MKVQGLNAVLRKLNALRKQSKEADASVFVGYTQNYALWVHEIPAQHKEGKQWKYLETPARQLRKELAGIVMSVFQKTGSMRKGLMIAGLRLQRASQEIVPIDTSALKASAFTAFEEDAPAAASAAFSKSEKYKTRGMKTKKALRSRVRKLKQDMKKASKKGKK